MEKLEKTNMERYYNMKKLSEAEIEQKTRMLFSHSVLTIRHGIVALKKIRQKKEAA